MQHGFDRLHAMTDGADEAKIRSAFYALVPEYLGVLEAPAVKPVTSPARQTPGPSAAEEARVVVAGLPQEGSRA